MIGSGAHRGRERRVKIFVVMAVGCLSACSWFGAKRQMMVDPTEIMVSGAPAGSVILVDDKEAGEASPMTGHPQIIGVAPGTHRVEVRLGRPVYREEIDIRRGERRAITVLSGSNR